MKTNIFLAALAVLLAGCTSARHASDNTDQSSFCNQESGAPVVYMTQDISPASLVRIYEALGWTPSGKTAVKISTGEPPASNYLRPELIGDLVQKLDGTIVECNTAYGGSRASSAMHRQVAEDHGFTAIADFDLMDEEGEVEWPVTGGSRLRDQKCRHRHFFSERQSLCTQRRNKDQRQHHAQRPGRVAGGAG